MNKKTKQMFQTFSLILCLLTIFIFVGCSNKKDSNSLKDGISIITILEAKQMIVNELESEDEDNDMNINNIQINSRVKKVSKQKKNRNIFQKLKVTDFECSWSDNSMNVLKGKLKRENRKWTSYSLIQGNVKEYYDNDVVYQMIDKDKNKTTFEDAMFGNIVQYLDYIFINYLFEDDAWEEIYENKAEKNKSKDTIKISLNINTANFMDYITRNAVKNNLPTDGLFGEGELLTKNKKQGKVKLCMKFYKNKLIGMDYVITSLAVTGSIENTKLVTIAMKINKSQIKVLTPKWFNANDFN